jgi:hypothetical protein
VFADYEVAADGKRFVMFPKPTDTGAPAGGMLTIVSNWFDELARTMQKR